jgi:hypothetical protein
MEGVDKRPMFNVDEVRRLEEILNSRGEGEEGQGFRFLQHWSADVSSESNGTALKVLLSSVSKRSSIVVTVDEVLFPPIDRSPQQPPSVYTDRVDYIASLIQETFHNEPRPQTNSAHRLLP